MRGQKETACLLNICACTVSAQRLHTPQTRCSSTNVTANAAWTFYCYTALQDTFRAAQMLYYECSIF